MFSYSTFGNNENEMMSRDWNLRKHFSLFIIQNLQFKTPSDWENDQTDHHHTTACSHNIIRKENFHFLTIITRNNNNNYLQERNSDKMAKVTDIQDDMM